MQREGNTRGQRLQPATGKQRGYLKHLRAELGLTDALPARLNRAQAGDLIDACKSILAARDTGENVESYHGIVREGGWTVTRLPDGERPGGKRRGKKKRPARARKPKPVKTTPEADAEWTAAVERHKRAQAHEEHRWMEDVM